jgi:hypothetical protein
MLKIKKLGAILCTATLLLAACGTESGQEVAAIPTNTLAPLISLTPRMTATPFITRTPLPTFTPIPSETPIPPTPSDTPTPTATPPIIGIIQSMQTVNVREGPATSYSAILALVPGTGVEVLGQNPEGSWLNIKTDDGDEGWISAALVFLEPTATPFPTMTPTPDETALALGTSLPTAVIGGGPVTATPPPAAVSATPVGSAPVDEATAPPQAAEPTSPFLPIIDVEGINQTATAMAGGAAALASPTLPPTAVADRSPNNLPTPGTVTPAPTGSTGGGTSVRHGVEVFAMCDDPSFGVSPPNNLAAGSTIVVFWGWFMSDPSYLAQHLDAVTYEVRVNNTLLSEWREHGAALRRSGNNHVQYWFVPFGPLESGDYQITYRATWSRVISDGYESFGPGTANPVETGSCTFHVP